MESRIDVKVDLSCVGHFSVNLATIKSNLVSIPISIINNKCTEENQTVETLGLIDSGAGEKFIDQNFAKTIGLKTQPQKDRKKKGRTIQSYQSHQTSHLSIGIA